MSGGIAVNFLAHLFQEGYQCRSLNVYRSTIPSMHEKVDDYEVGQRPFFLLGCSRECFGANTATCGGVPCKGHGCMVEARTALGLRLK